MKEKKYLSIILSLIIVFLGYHFIVWNLLTKEFLINENNMHTGDLGRMSYLSRSLTTRKNEQNLQLKHIDYNDTIVDVITIGDSFSNGGGGGTNKYYQDYIATNQNLKVMNIQRHKKGFIETVLILNSIGILDNLKVKIILLQSIERTAISRYAKNINWNIGLKNNSLNFLNKKHSNTIKSPSFINNLNYNSLIYNILYKYDDNAIFSKNYIADISKNFFSCEDKDRLLFYYRDLKSIPLSNNNSITLLNNNLNKLQKILNKKNIQLYFMPSVDKYNLYSKYIKNNNYPKSTFFEILRPLKKEYTLIDTKMILGKMLENNIIDVFYSDDTHWSFKASNEIFNQIKLNSFKNNREYKNNYVNPNN